MQTNYVMIFTKKEKTESLTKNSLFYLVYNVLNVVFPFISGIYVARILLPDSIGAVDAARNLAQYFVVFSFLGIPTYGLREIAKHRNNKEELNKVFSELVVINSISTTVFLSIYLAIIFLIRPYSLNIPLYLITGLSIALNFLNISWLFAGLEKFAFISIRNIAFKLVSLVLLIVFVKSNGDYLKYALITVVGTAGNYLLNVLSSGRFVCFSFRGLNLRRHLKPVFFLVVVNLAIELYSLVDITMLNLLSTKESIAFYSYGKKVFDILKTIINTFTIVLVPRIASAYKNGEHALFNSVVSKAFKIILILSIPMIIGLFFVGNDALVFLYGNEYIRSSELLKIISFLLIISPTGYLLGSRILLVTNNENKMIFPVLAGAVVNIIGNFIFIVLWSEYGAAFSSVLSECVVMVIYLLLSRKYLKISGFKNSSLKIILALTIMTNYLIIIHMSISFNLLRMFLEVFGASLIYFLLLLLLKEDTVYSFFQKMVRVFKKNEKRTNC